MIGRAEKNYHTMAKQIVHLCKPTTANAGNRYAIKTETAYPNAQPNYEIINRIPSASLIAVVGNLCPNYIESLRNRPCLFRAVTMSTTISRYLEPYIVLTTKPL